MLGKTTKLWPCTSILSTILTINFVLPCLTVKQVEVLILVSLQLIFLSHSVVSNEMMNGHRMETHIKGVSGLLAYTSLSVVAPQKSCSQTQIWFLLKNTECILGSTNSLAPGKETTCYYTRLKFSARKTIIRELINDCLRSRPAQRNSNAPFLWNLEEIAFITDVYFLDSHTAIAKSSPTSPNKTTHSRGKRSTMQRWANMV